MHNMNNIAMTGNSKAITGKGKSCASYKKINGVVVPVWIALNGGIENIKQIIKELIIEGMDYHQIRVKFNISSSTMIRFIRNNIEEEIVSMELVNRKLNSSTRRSNALKGIPSSLRGKTYKEIYGESLPKCGFKKGNENPNFTRDKYIGRSLVNTSGKKFRSSYEVLFSEILESYNIEYTYEHHYRLLNGKVKIVDFVVNNILIEVTGYAYLKWQQDFDIKIALLHKSYPDHHIMIVCDCGKLNLLKERHSEYCTVVSLNDIDNIINALNRLTSMH